MPGTWSHIAYAAGKLTGIQSLIDYAMTTDAKADAEAAKNDPKATQLSICTRNGNLDSNRML
jgi:hypothetical protein